MRRIMPFVIAALSGIAVALSQACVPVVAQAMDAPSVWSAPDLETMLTQGAVAAAVVTGAMLFIRSAFRKWLAPEPGTEASRLANLVLVMLLGLGAGAFHLGPQVAPGLSGWLLGGIVSGAVAAFGRDVVVSGYRVGKQ